VKVSAAPRADTMTLVLSKAVFVQLCRIRNTSRPRRAAKVSLIGRRSGKRVVIESARRTEAVGRRSLPTVVGEVFFHPDGQYLLTPSEKQHISDMLREKTEVAVVVTVIARNGDLAFYPVYFSQDIPNGVDMALEYEGSTVCQSRSALGGSCGAPWKETKIRTDHRQVPVYIHGRWITVDRKLARLVRRVNQIPGIASLRSCQGGIPDDGKSRHDSPAQAYLSVVPVQYAWVDFAEYRRLEALRRKPDPRLADITRRLQLKFEERLQKPLALTCARDPSKYWKRKRTTEMYPKLWLNGFVSVFYWDPKESPKMLASVEDLVQEEKDQLRNRAN
jgi:hypothetical protein